MATTLITGRDGSLKIGATPATLVVRGWEYSEEAAVASGATSGSSGWKQSAPGARSWTFKCTVPLAAGSMGAGTGANLPDTLLVGTTIQVEAHTTTSGNGTKLTGYAVVRRIGTLTVHNDGTDFLGVDVECTGDGAPTWGNQA